MNVLLIDIDSKISNLALMKISAYHKSMGDDVGFNNTNSPDIVYASVILQKNKHKVDGLKFYYPNAEIILGGSGYNLKVKLPDSIESLKPDYDLYPDIDHSLGYSSRGCNRKCSFCLVPQKEGRFKIHQHPSKFYDDRFSKIVFLDNNIMLDKKWFFEVMDFCIDHSLSIDFNQGLDIRLVDDAVVKKLTEAKFHSGYRFAFDDSGLANTVKEKCKLLSDYGIRIRSDVQFYVYVDNDSMYDDGVWRCRYLKELNTNPFVQYDINKKPTSRINMLRWWANRKQAFWSCDISDCTRKKRKTRKKKVIA